MAYGVSRVARYFSRIFMPLSHRVPLTTAEPDRLRPYLFHGVAFSANSGQAVGDCPFCGRETKFSVEVATGLYRCFVCGAAGNGLVFTRAVYEQAASTHRNAPGTPQGGPGGPVGGLAYPRPQDAAGAGLGGPGAWLVAVAGDRRLLYPATVAAWGLCPGAGGTWLVPGYGTDGRLDQVYRRTRVRGADGEWSWRLLPTPGIWPEGKVHALHMPAADFDPTRPNVVVCEGPWDGMAMWEVWPRDSLTNIVSVPGCNVWRDEWTQLCRGKCVTLMYDSDHPREAVPGSGRVSRAGYDGMVRAAIKLSGVAASVRWLKWGQDGWDQSKPSGYDVRDFLTCQ